MSNYYKINQYDTANGPGLRTTIFFTGCDTGCKNCFNKEIWDFNKGVPFNKDTYKNIIKPTINEHVTGLSILGGEPLHPKNIATTCQLVELFKHDYPHKTVWIWTGYTFDYTWILAEECPEYVKFLSKIYKEIDILIDGQFIEKKKDLKLKWRGSSNQRVIDMKKTWNKEKVVLYCD